MKFFKGLPVLLFITLPALLFAQPVNTDVINKIRQEGLQNSKVMDIAFHLTDVNGPRVTASPGLMRASDYAIKKLTDWGLSGAKLDAWGDFGKGWELEKSYVAITSPWYKSISAYPKVWTGGTDGLKSGDMVLISAKDSAGLDAYRGKLKGKILILDNTINYKQRFNADAIRYTDAELDSMQQMQLKPVDTAAMRQRMEQFRSRNRGGLRSMMSALMEMAKKEGAIAMVSSGARNHDGTIFVQQAGPYKISDPANFLDIAIGLEDFNMMVRLLRNNTPVKMDLDVKTKFQTKDTKGYNVIAEIKGSDKNLKDEIVMLGGHLDSWHGSTGATDNASGSAVMMEAVRILKALNLQPKRTIRIALWSGEEQGIYGSREYVKKTFGDRATMKLLPAHEKFSVYFNLDNGTGKIRGIHLQENEAARETFTNWFAPFADLDAKTITISNTGGTDHLSFDALGLPGFQFIQDPIEYDTRTHHSNMDSYDHLIEDDLKQAATIVAALVYNASMADQKVPRKAMPAATPGR